MLRAADRSTLLCAGLLITALAPAAEAPPDAEAIYKQRCASCHDLPVERAPSRTALRELTPESIVTAMTRGVMQPQSSGLSGQEVRAVASFLSAKPFATAVASTPLPNLCKDPAAPLDATATHWNGWSSDIENTRLQPNPGIVAKDVPKLKVKWAYAYPGRGAYGQPTLVGDKLFVTSSGGQVSSLNAQSGCAYWTYEAGAGVRASVSIASTGSAGAAAVLIGDEKSFVHAVDAQSGAPLWKIKIEEHRVSRITGSPKAHGGVLYVPVSSFEEGSSRDAKYECCTFRGSVVAIDIASGKVLWKSHAIPQEPKPYRKNTAGTQMHGPAGAAIWSSPTVDAKRGLIYVGTGNSYTDVATDASDAIVAFDKETGERRWVNQVTANDNYLVGCSGANVGKNNCPQNVGPDHDFGSSPMLRTLPDGKQILIAGQKSGVVYGMDPEQQGKILWQTQIGKGSPLGGIEWGPAADERRAYVAVSDALAGEGGRPGLSALELVSGKVLWSTATPQVTCSWAADQRCGRGQPGAVTAIPGVVFSGALDGHIRAYDANTGSIVWDFDTAPARDTINGLHVEGGSIDAGGPVVANGVLYVNSGYGSWGKTGRLLLAFTVDGK